ncbi:MAG TPA: hypothetical protein P5201_11840 [Aminobacteriaceae bacterium]|nr:hypothetical protein [Synergistaceae bacterium]NLD96652.1 hypothetical protein [Synergistaceae bacterium]HOO88225.1 hypothetical protein [Synergistales bacterium]HRV99280.1 hypothetical protein [Aminobacteriaceae bacterium]
MAISTAVQKGSTVYVYNEKNGQICAKSGTLMGFTSTTFSVKQGNTVYTYNEKGGMISAH